MLFEVLASSGLELSAPVAVELIDGREVFVVADGDLIACLAKDVSPAAVLEIAHRAPSRAVFLDSAFATDADRVSAWRGLHRDIPRDRPPGDLNPMRLRFKVQRYQTAAVDAVADCFDGQPRRHRADHGANEEIALSPAELLANIRAVQRERGLPLSAELAQSAAAGAPGTPNLDVEMETGTGKTYVYIKTIMELNKRYGWSKFIVVVPSVAIREGVRASFEVTAEHFLQAYGGKPRSFSYDSRRLHELERFSSDAGVQVLIINVQAFNAAGQESRRIYQVLDDFQSRRPIDVISAARPVVIIDEPQKIGAARSLEALSLFNPLMILRYSATHRVEHNKVHRLGALDAYQQQLVKKIAVRGITVQGLAGAAAYLYLDAIETAKATSPRARIELEVRTASGITRQLRRLGPGADLHRSSGGIDAYLGLRIADIDAGRNVIELSGGNVIAVGQATADVTEDAKRRIQIREVIRAHLDKERELFPLGIKVLSLFFIDEVARYRDYRRADTRGEYARAFTEEYTGQVHDRLLELAADGDPTGYGAYLAAIPVDDDAPGILLRRQEDRPRHRRRPAGSRR